MNKRLAYVGLGANIGDPKQQLKDACRQLHSIAGVVESRCSSFYLTEPVGYSDQPDFVNAVLELTLELSVSAFDLLLAMQQVENNIGRERDPNNQNAPRVIDCDLLLFGNMDINTPALTVPHPRMTARLFVMQPLAELNPLVEIGQYGSSQNILDSLLNSEEMSSQAINLTTFD